MFLKKIATIILALTITANLSLHAQSATITLAQELTSLIEDNKTATITELTIRDLYLSPGIEANTFVSHILSLFPNITKLTIARITSLTTLDLSHLTTLTHLELQDLRDLIKLDINIEINLIDLKIRDLDYLKILDLSNLVNLHRLEIISSKNLEKLNLERSTHLTYLKLINLDTLPTYNCILPITLPTKNIILKDCPELTDLIPTFVRNKNELKAFTIIMQKTGILPAEWLGPIAAYKNGSGVEALILTQHFQNAEQVEALEATINH